MVTWYRELTEDTSRVLTCGGPEISVVTSVCVSCDLHIVDVGRIQSLWRPPKYRVYNFRRIGIPTLDTGMQLSFDVSTAAFERSRVCGGGPLGFRAMSFAKAGNSGLDLSEFLSHG